MLHRCPLPNIPQPGSTFAVLMVLCGLLTFFVGCGSGDPFSYVQVSGTITYDDGSSIPAKNLVLNFIPQGGALNEKTYPRPGETRVDSATGEFRDVTSYKPNDGLARGKYKVIICTGNGVPLPPHVIPREYMDVAKTPLEVDTADQPFTLKVRKPQRR